MKEAFHNSLKHSAATELHLRLSVGPAFLILAVEDNGIGFRPTAAQRSGDGLGNMRQRTARLGGTFSITSASGQGTQVQVRVPLTGAA